MFEVVNRMLCDAIKSPLNVSSYQLADFHISLFDLTHFVCDIIINNKFYVYMYSICLCC